LEAIRAIQESGIFIPCPIELLVFTDEEGGHFAGTFGSRAMFNLLAEGEIHRSKGNGQRSLAEDLRRAGKDPSQISRAVRSPAEFRAFLELHIEQGPLLDSAGIPIGIVEGIVSIDRYFIKVKGRPGHAGTIPMHLRDDALVKAARIITAVNEALLAAGSDIVGTIGEMKVYPGAFNIIPGVVDMYLDLRSWSESARLSMRNILERIIASVENAQIELLLSKPGVTMNPAVMEAIARSCEERGTPYQRIFSGAGHDAMTLAARGIPMGMIFIPCLEGKSHCPEEEIRFEDAAVGAQILADTMIRIAASSL
jgi:hydantoinase/carbamoylase family amidase